MKYILQLTTLLILLSSCENHSKNKSSSYEHEDGIYCADVEYFYNKTGTRSDYTLEVKIENDKLVKIYWSSGGWLDNNHFSPPNISNNYTEFTSERDVTYEIRIIGEQGDCRPSHYSKSEEAFIDDAEEDVCPICGGYKYSFDEYCDLCSNKNTCSRCGGYDYGVNGGLCSSCQKYEDEEW